MHFPPSAFRATTARQWEHGWRSGSILASRPADGQKFKVVEYNQDVSTDSELLLLKDLQVHVELKLDSTNASGSFRFFWYQIPINSDITATTISQKDTRRIWNPMPLSITTSSISTNSIASRTFRFPKKQIGSGDRFGLGVMYISVGSNNPGFTLTATATWLYAEHG